VQRYGGTPGKLIVGIRILKIDGTPVGYREALLRVAPGFLMGKTLAIGRISALNKISDSAFQSFTFRDRGRRITQLVPSWHHPLYYANLLWTVADIVVFFANDKHRALHDFIAGTIVVFVIPVEQQGLANAAI
jgi:uncharacterized RDD family membrane protein YckC